MRMYSDHMFRSLDMFPAGRGVGKKKNLCCTPTKPQAGVQRSTRYGGGTLNVGWGRGVKEDPGFWFGRTEVTVTRDGICGDEHEGLGTKGGWGVERR